MMKYHSKSYYSTQEATELMFGDTPSNRKRLIRLLQTGEVKGKKFGKRWFVFSSEIDANMVFQDCPKAVAEYELEANVKSYKPVAPEVHAGVSDLGGVIIDSHKYDYKRGSARDGTRYTYKKDDK